MCNWANQCIGDAIHLSLPDVPDGKRWAPNDATCESMLQQLASWARCHLLQLLLLPWHAWCCSSQSVKRHSFTSGTEQISDVTLTNVENGLGWAPTPARDWCARSQLIMG